MALVQGEGAARMVVPAQMVHVSEDVARITRPDQPAAEPTIELIRRGNEIEAIEVRCECGKRIRLRCVYD
jgi:hypothetical protein